MKHTLLRKRYFQALAVLGLADCLVAALVNPTEASAQWLIIGYILLGVTLFVLAECLARALRSYGKRVYRTGRRLLFYGVAIVVSLIGLQSIGQLTMRDVVTLLPLAVLAYAYFGYGKRSTPAEVT